MLSQLLANVSSILTGKATQSQLMCSKVEARTNADAKCPITAKRVEPNLGKRVHATAPSPAGRAGEGEQSPRQRAPWKGPEGVGQGLPCQEDRPKITSSEIF